MTLYKTTELKSGQFYRCRLSGLSGMVYYSFGVPYFRMYADGMYHDVLV